MAENQTIIAVNLGSQRISMAVFEKSKKNQLILKAYDSDMITIDPSLEASRESQIRASLAEMVERLNVRKSKVRYSIPSQSVFTRFVKLPPLQDDNVEKIVAFEAQQHVPFPISEVIWDYELLESSSEKEVIIVAVKEDILDDINSGITNLGLTTIEVDIAPTALYNSYINAYGEPVEPTLIIDIGSKTTNLLYIEGKRFFTRSVSIGGSSVSSAIAKEYQITFPEAELQKVNNGLVALGGEHSESMSESQAALAMVIRNTLNRLPSEIARTTNYYRSQHGGNPPKKVVLAGGGANLLYTLEFFQEKLDLPVDFFNPLNGISIGDSVDFDKLRLEAHTMGELIGLGLRGVGKSKINIDLVPSAVRISRFAQKRKPFFVAAASVLVAGLGVFSLLQYISLQKACEKSLIMGDSQKAITPIAAQIRELIGQEKQINSVADAYTKIESDNAIWFELMNEISSAFAHDSVWITEMEPLYEYDFDKTDKNSSGNKPHFVVKNDYVNNKGSLIMEPIPTTKQNTTSSQSKAVNSDVMLAKAISVKGLWRANDRNQNLVSDCINKLRINSKVFKFTTIGKDGKDTPITDEKIYNSISTGANEKGDLAFSFEVTLPLARYIQIK